MAHSLYFYDLETTGFSPRTGRIMQFAGQRTDMDLRPLGEPHDILIKLTEDVLPDPEAILVTAITPQKTLGEGMTEAEFLNMFNREIATPDTIFAGFNSVRFDDEFLRYMHYRNYYDPYEWHWKEGRSRWDLLDVVRATRALRPQGIEWPFDVKGVASNRLELLTGINNLAHVRAHNALDDVGAVIALAGLIKDKQPKLFDWMLQIRDKKRVAQFVMNNELFIYTSGKYPSEFEKTTVVSAVADHPDRQGVLVYDLRYDPTQFANLTVPELAAAWKRRKQEEGGRLPIKVLQFNRCPAIAPLSVLDEASQQRLKLDLSIIEKHQAQLALLSDWKGRVVEALKMLEQQKQASFLVDERTVDEQLYDGFFARQDKLHMEGLRSADPSAMTDFTDRFSDMRLKALLPLYKARNYPKYLNDDERVAWETYRRDKLLAGGENSPLQRFFMRLDELKQRTDLAADDRYLLDELALYGQSIMPEI